MIPIADQIKCVEREIAMRRIVYAKRVGARAMTKETADLELARMEAVLVTLKAQDLRTASCLHCEIAAVMMKWQRTKRAPSTELIAKLVENLADVVASQDLILHDAIVEAALQRLRECIAERNADPSRFH